MAKLPGDELNARVEQFDALIDRLKREVHAFANSKEAKHWGHVGSLGHVNAELLDVLRFMTGE